MRTLAEELAQLLPESLDDIIRANRDKAQLYFSTDEELAPYRGPVGFGDTKGQVSDWAFISLYLVESRASFIYLVGFNETTQRTLMTSFITGIEDRKVTTKSGSYYELIGDRTLDVDLVHICATLHLWGIGPGLGVPHFFF